MKVEEAEVKGISEPSGNEETTFEELIFIIGEKTVNERVKTRVITQLRAQAQNLSEVLLKERSVSAKHKGQVEDMERSLKSLQSRVVELENRAHELALLRDTHTKRISELEKQIGDLRNVQPD